MKMKWVDQNFKYDGSQLHSLFAYLDHQILGDSIVAWRGECDIPFGHMVDGEDLLQESQIQGSDMLHFIIEMFDRNLREAVWVQRLFASIVMNLLMEKKPDLRLRRDGDDIYWQEQKLSISIATCSPVSALVHFAVNISNQGTPVPTCALQDWNIDPEVFAQDCLEKFCQEFQSVVIATQKVKPVV